MYIGNNCLNRSFSLLTNDIMTIIVILYKCLTNTFIFWALLSLHLTNLTQLTLSDRFYAFIFGVKKVFAYANLESVN